MTARAALVAAVLGLGVVTVRPAVAGSCRKSDPKGPRIRTLAYIVSECREVPGGLVGHQVLQVRRGDCDPVTVIEFRAPETLPDPLGLCRIFGTDREGPS